MSECAAKLAGAAKPKAPAPGLRRLEPYWHEFCVKAKTRWHGRELLEVFTTEFRDRTKEYYLWAIHNGLSTVNGQQVEPTYTIQENDMIVNRVHRHEPAVSDEPVRIIHRDDKKGQLVVVKPGSIPVHATGRFRYHTLVEMVKEQANIEKLYTSNRLDRLTSGVMVCSTTREAACSLGNDFNAGLVNKAYVCRVDGHFPDGRVVCTEPILAVDRQSGLNIVHPKGKDCKTIFERLHYDADTDTSVLVCRPITGRTHQIRVHAQSLGHPISNDPLYNHEIWDTVDSDVLATAQPRMYERVGGETGNVELERVLEALKGSRDDSEGWARWRDDVIFGKLNREAGYEDVFVPGPNGVAAEAPPEGEEPLTDARLCDVCRVPLLADPAPEELFIYLHAIKYWTDAWVFEDVLPWWARTDWLAPGPEEQRLPPLELVSHHDGSSTVGKGGARRRNSESIMPQEWLVQHPLSIASELDDTPPAPLPVDIEVTRGLEDVALVDTLRRLQARANGAYCEPELQESALHSGAIRLDPKSGAGAASLFTNNALPCALGVYYELARAIMPQPMLDALFAERAAALGATRCVQERKAAYTPSEGNLFEFVRNLWQSAEKELATLIPRGGNFSLSVDRSSYVLPTLSTADFEGEIAVYISETLSRYGSWELAPRDSASLHIKLTMAPRLGVDETLHAGPRDRQGNPAGTLLIQAHVSQKPLGNGTAVRDAMASARAHSIVCLLPLARDATVIGVAGDDGSMVVALAEAMQAHGISGKIVAYGRRVDSVRQLLDVGADGLVCIAGQQVSVDAEGPVALKRVAEALDAAVLELPELQRDIKRADLFDLYYDDVCALHDIMAPGARAILLTGEPKTMLRALRELENTSRRDEGADYSLAHEPLVWRTQDKLPVQHDVKRSLELTNEQFEAEEVAANNVTVASLTLYLWEYIATLPREVMMYQRHMLVRPQVVLFLLIRYGTLPAIVITTYSFFGRFDNCIQHQAITIALVQFLLSCIFSWRTSAIWRHHKPIVVFLCVLVCMVTAASIGLMYFLEYVPITSYDGVCRPGIHEDSNNPNTAPWFYLTSMIFDTITMVLSSYKLIMYARLGRDLEQPVFRDPFSNKKEPLVVPEGEDMPKRSFWRRCSMHAVNLRNTVTASVSFYRSLHSWTISFTPLIARIFYNGLVYFAVATAFNLVNMILELSKSIHSKTLLPLYAPLMCVLCQRMLLIEFDFVWASNLPHLELPGLRLVGQVTGKQRKSAQQSETDRLTELIESLEERRNSAMPPHRKSCDLDAGLNNELPKLSPKQRQQALRMAGM
ncbi:hypothetical protein MCUN1_001774 [Malassezia cuniculi]|uniref:Pseudouridine synthase RsuA/RluA-like domain-containing protein n=1 Tax=Malassezia cuniculi TaxID=948313 RepID=A0AAF0EYG3_9BASI|nr:hypothetical protein MCUN1_001774 [Malassezia cuniculi]